jgi:hypothetical protein
MPSKKPKAAGAQFSVVRIGWEDAEMTQPLYRFRCEVCGALFGIAGYRKLLENHARLHESQRRSGRLHFVDPPRQREADSPSESRTDSKPAPPCLRQADRRIGLRSED